MKTFAPNTPRSVPPVPPHRAAHRLASAAETPSTTPGDGATPEEFAHRVVQIALNHLATRSEQPVVSRRSRQRMIDDLGLGTLPHSPIDPATLLDQLESAYLPALGLSAHPSFFAFVPGPSNAFSPWLALLAAVYNACPGAWVAAPAATAVEREVIAWLCELMGLPDSAGGTLTSGGSEATLIALKVARHAMLDDRPDPAAVAYASDQAHHAVSRAHNILGFARDQLRAVPCDENQRLDTAALATMIEEDAASGRRPYLVVATAGTTSTGATDPLREIAALCRTRELWLHIDAAFGAGARIGRDPAERARVDGIEEANSLILDPHKMLLQPYGTGAVLVRDGMDLPKAFASHPAAYLQDAAGEVNLHEYGIQVSRPDRALPVWASVRALGLDSVADALDHGYRLARAAERHLDSRSCWEVTSPAQLGVVTFRYRHDHGERCDEIQRRIVQMALDDGSSMVLSTLVNGSVSLRMMTINRETSPDRVRATIDLLESFGARAALELESECCS